MSGLVQDAKAPVLAMPVSEERQSLPTCQALYFVPYAMALLAPNLVQFLLEPTVRNFGKLAVCAAFLLAWHLMFSRLSLAVATLLPVFLLLPFDLFFTITYGQTPSVAVLAIIADTNINEASDYLDGRMPLAFAALACSLAIWAAAFRASLRRAALPGAAVAPGAR